METTLSNVPHKVWHVASEPRVQALVRYPAGWEIVCDDGSRVWLDDDGFPPEWDSPVA